MSDGTFVLVPGAGGAAWTWHRVVAELERRGRSAIAVGLPGEDESAGLPEYAQLIVDAARGADDVVLVAQSLGGFSASLACPQLPVSSLVLVNAMIPTPGETAGAWWAAVDQEGARRANDVREGRDPDVEPDLVELFMHDVPADLVAESLEHAGGESAAVFDAPWDLPAWPDVPTRVVAGRDDRFLPWDLQRRVSQQRLGITPEVLPGGHLLALSRPVELVDLLLRA